MPRETDAGWRGGSRACCVSQTAEARDEAASESYLNDEGTGLAELGLFDPAIKILLLNTELYPNSANTWDSVGYAYAKKGDKDEARKYYRKALEIDPRFPSAIAAMEKLGD
ncbi:MAG: tetratricopeptide repeat protein [Rhodanobacteraceae bacterium]|nr:tetratricopeptide repeat protein [Rhodanobacteraceae bacterium]